MRSLIALSTARVLSRTKGLIIMITVIFTVWLVQNGAPFAAVLNGQFAAFLFKMCELGLTYKSKTYTQVATHVGSTVVAQALSLGVFLLVMMEFTHGWQ